MARWYQVLQRQSDQRWDMTVSSEDEGWARAIGYCVGQKKCQACDVWTAHRVDSGGGVARCFIVCPEHSIRDHVKQLMEEKRDVAR